jgi:hypothetical protein
MPNRRVDRRSRIREMLQNVVVRDEVKVLVITQYRRKEAASDGRWQLASFGHLFIWFDSEHDYPARSRSTQEPAIGRSDIKQSFFRKRSECIKGIENSSIVLRADRLKSTFTKAFVNLATFMGIDGDVQARGPAATVRAAKGPRAQMRAHLTPARATTQSGICGHWSTFTI